MWSIVAVLKAHGAFEQSLCAMVYGPANSVSGPKVSRMKINEGLGKTAKMVKGRN